MKLFEKIVKILSLIMIPIMVFVGAFLFFSLLNFGLPDCPFEGCY